MTLQEMIDKLERTVECSEPECAGCLARPSVEDLARDLLAGVRLPNRDCGPDTDDEVALRRRIIDTSIPFFEQAITLVMMAQGHLNASGEKVCINSAAVVDVVLRITQRALADLLHTHVALQWQIAQTIAPAHDPMNPQNLPVSKAKH